MPQLYGTWICEHAHCAICNHVWVAVHPEALKLECPECGYYVESSEGTFRFNVVDDPKPNRGG